MVSRTLFEISYLFASHTHDLSKARFCQIIINPLFFCFTKHKATNVKFFLCSIFFYSSESLFRINEGCLKGLISNHHHSFCGFYEIFLFLEGFCHGSVSIFLSLSIIKPSHLVEILSKNIMISYFYNTTRKS